MRSALLVQTFIIMLVVTALVLGTSRDETARASVDLRQAEREAAAHADLFEAVLDSMHEGVLVLEGSRVVFENPGAREHLAGTTTPTGAEAVAGPVVLSDGTRLDPGRQSVVRALAGESVNDLDVLLESEAGPRTMSVSLRPLRSGPGDADRAVIVFRDVTQDRAERADLVAFSGVVAHDLRNPLQVIEGWLDQLQDEIDERSADGGSLDPVAAGKAVERALRGAERMGHLIQDLLDRAMSSERIIQSRPLDLAAVARDAASGRDLDLEVGRLPEVSADPVLVRQLFDNLVGNAVKYVADGVRPRVAITGEPVADDAGRWVRVRIADNGIGIPAGQHQLVFRQFHRAHADRYVGTGLGLSICQRIIERHGGTIRAFDHLGGRGTVFEFTLPART